MYLKIFRHVKVSEYICLACLISFSLFLSFFFSWETNAGSRANVLRISGCGKQRIFVWFFSFSLSLSSVLWERVHSGYCYVLCLCLTFPFLLPLSRILTALRVFRSFHRPDLSPSTAFTIPFPFSPSFASFPEWRSLFANYTSRLSVPVRECPDVHG